MRFLTVPPLPNIPYVGWSSTEQYGVTNFFPKPQHSERGEGRRKTESLPNAFVTRCRWQLQLHSSFGVDIMGRRLIIVCASMVTNLIFCYNYITNIGNFRVMTIYSVYACTRKQKWNGIVLAAPLDESDRKGLIVNRPVWVIWGRHSQKWAVLVSVVFPSKLAINGQTKLQILKASLQAVFKNAKNKTAIWRISSIFARSFLAWISAWNSSKDPLQCTKGSPFSFSLFFSPCPSHFHYQPLMI